MPMTTFLRDEEIGQFLPDPQCQGMLHEVRKRTKQDWQVVGTMVRESTGKLWPRTHLVKRWSIYVYVGGAGPWQMINFYNDTPGGSSIHTVVPLSCIGAYLNGIIVGLDTAAQWPNPV